MIRSNVYLNFNGNTEEAFDFYKTVFKGKITRLERFKNTSEGKKLPKKDQNKIMHIQLQIDKNTVIKATDALESMGQKLVQGNNFYIQIEPENIEEVDRIYSLLSKGGKTEMKPQSSFHGIYITMFMDKFGVQWMITCHNFKKRR